VLIDGARSFGALRHGRLFSWRPAVFIVDQKARTVSNYLPRPRTSE
jgi:hypothetical protein